MTNVALFVTLLAAAFGAAIVFGGAPERWTAAMLASAALATFLLYRSPAERLYTVEHAVLVVDVALLTGVTVILLSADRFWPIAMFAAHGVTVLAHVVKALDATIIRRAYLIATAMPGYATLLILLVAVVRHRRRVRIQGGDRDWSAQDGDPT